MPGQNQPVNVLNPLELKITEVTIEKFNNQDRMSILPQFVELTLYQSIFESSLKAEMLVNDQIGLFVNYPFTGEELITISYLQNNGMSNAGVAGSDKIAKTINFIIKGVRNIIVGDRARSLMYIIDLISPQQLFNMRKYVSHAYNDKIEKMANDLYLEYIAQDTQIKFNLYKDFITEESIKIRSLVVPNLRPLNAIQWLAKHAVASDHENHFVYLFYEDLENYNFLTIQKLIEDAQANKDALRTKKYVYVSDTELNKNKAPSDPEQDIRIITNLVFNKRFSSIEKIAGGYYQNELLEISLLQKSYKSTVTELQKEKDPKFGLEKYPANSPEYIQYVKNEADKTEYANRIRYIINNYDDFNSNEGLTQPNYRYKFGSSTKFMYALNQIDLSITIPANMKIKPGDVIWCDIPENHGFNVVQYDQYLSGLFIVSEVKQVISVGDKATTSLRIYKDSYFNRLLETSEYNTSVTSPRVTGGHA